MSRTITAQELKTVLAQGDHPILLDVRRKNDYDADRVKLPGAQWHDPEQIAEWSKSLPHGKEVMIYCARGGSVSNSVVDQLRGQGIPARFIEGGIEAWKREGGNVVGG